MVARPRRSRRGSNAARSKCSPRPRPTANSRGTSDRDPPRPRHGRGARDRAGAAISPPTTCASTRTTGRERDRIGRRPPGDRASAPAEELRARRHHHRARRRLLADRRSREPLHRLASPGSRSARSATRTPRITAAVAKQAATLVHCQQPLSTTNRPARSPTRLAERTGFERVFFCNSGAEANEAAIKLARKRAYRRGQNRAHEDPRVPRARSTGARSARWPRPTTRSTKRASSRCRAASRSRRFNDVDALDDGDRRRRPRPSSSSRCRARAASRPPRREFLAAARRLCNERGALLIFDEMQCGMGRLGTTVRLRALRRAPGRVHDGQGAGQRPADRRAASCAARAATRCSPATTARRSAVRRCRARPRSSTSRVRDRLDLDAHVQTPAARSKPR